MNYGSLKSRLLRILGDTPIVLGAADEETGIFTPIHGSQYDADLLLDAICAALDAITVRIWKQVTVAYAGGVGIRTCLLPSEFIAVEGVYDNHYQVFIPRIDLRADRTLFDVWANAWFEYPTGTLQFMNDIQNGVTLYYASHFTDPSIIDTADYNGYDDVTGITIDDFVMDFPDIAINAVVMYSASYCLNQKAVRSAGIRQFNTKVDSGQPGDNTEQKMADHFLRRRGRINKMRST